MTDEPGNQRKLTKAEARELSRRLLLDAALRVMRRDGVLAGFRMQDVAEEAGMSRGLINYYFDNRGDLLRASLDQKRASLAESTRGHRRDRALLRVRRFFRIAISEPDYADVMTLLAVDADPEFEPMFWYDDQVADVRAEIDAGNLPDHDVEALLALLHATVFGYATFRQALARQVGVPVTELDRRVEDVLLLELFGGRLGGR